MSVHVKAQCRTGCGELGDPELEYLCVDCHADQIELRQQQDLRDYLANEAQTKAAATTCTSPPSPVKKYRGPRPVDHAKALETFMKRPREQDPAIIARELTFLKREIAVRETSKKQLRKYMIATDEEEQADPKEWGRYEFGPPKKVPVRNIDETTELAAQLKIFCHWRKRQVQRSIEIRRQQNEAARKELKRKNPGGIRSLALTSFGRSSKTAVDQSAQSAKSAPIRRPTALKVWNVKTNE